MTSYTITPVNGNFASEDYQRIRRALFPGGDRRERSVTGITTRFFLSLGNVFFSLILGAVALGFFWFYFPDWTLGGLLAAWSLAVEISFYAALPLLVLLMERPFMGRTRASLKCSND